MRQEHAPKLIVSAGPGMASSAPGEAPAYIATTDAEGYGFSLTRDPAEQTIELMVEDQTNCRVDPSQLEAALYRDRLVVTVLHDAVAGLGIPTDYVVVFSADNALLAAMDQALCAICSGIAAYSREF